MLSTEGLEALALLEHGAVLNHLHTTARELIGLGFADMSWGKLVITEAGRRHLRHQAHPVYVRAGGEFISELRDFVENNAQADPMANPQALPPAPFTLAEEKTETDKLPPAKDATVMLAWKERAMRAAGVASGKTGVWVEQIWIEEFVNALETE